MKTSLILVTGGCGFIGANLVSRLVAGGTAVRVLDNLSRGSLENLTRSDVEFMEGDIRDPQIVAQAATGVATVIHLAAYGSVIDSITDPFENFDVNARGTLTLLEACARADVEKFIFASTGGALIGNAVPPVDERSLPWPISPYGASKLCGEAYCHAFAGSYGLPTVALRFANVYGPYSDTKKGAVTKFIKSALLGQPLTIYGDGAASRDFLYVDDLCQGILAAVDAPLCDEVIHLASGRETSIKELAQLILDVAGRTDIPIDYQPRRQGEVERNFAKASRAAQLLGFCPATSLQTGIEKTVRWFDDHRARWESGR